MITINMDQKCKRCKKPGAANGGYCLECILKMMKEGKFDHIFDKVRNKMVIKKEGKEG
mgnify:CR=1 FL=1